MMMKCPEFQTLRYGSTSLAFQSNVDIIQHCFTSLIGFGKALYIVACTMKVKVNVISSTTLHLKLYSYVDETFIQ